MKKPTKSVEAKQTNEVRVDPKSFTELFSRAMKAFNAGEYRKARPLFEQASQGPAIAIKESSLMYMRMCDQRSSQEKLVLQSAEDYYNYGVGLMNDRRAAEARGYLDKAVALDAAPHILYAHALAAGLTGDIEQAAASLRRAVELDASLRGLARSDADFHPLLQHPAIREVLAAERQETA